MLIDCDIPLFGDLMNLANKTWLSYQVLFNFFHLQKFKGLYGGFRVSEARLRAQGELMPRNWYARSAVLKVKRVKSVSDQDPS